MAAPHAVGVRHGLGRSLGLQRGIARVFSPLSVLAVAGLLRFVLRYRIEDADRLRAAYARARGDGAPLLVCANHLTMIDSAVVSWALGSPLSYLRDFSALPWNTPERTRFAANPLTRVLAYLFKCVPIVRGGSRAAVAEVLGRVGELLAAGESVLIFPEGRRSRSGRVEVDSPAWGVGRVVRAVPNCRVLCVYLRGAGQTAFSTVPRPGETFRGRVSLLEPKSDARGLRASRDVAAQITCRLAELEQEHLDARQ